MSLTYSDFIYPQNSSDTEDKVSKLERRREYSSSNSINSSNYGPFKTYPYLPNEFQVIQDTPVPLLQNLDDADHDFIIIAEFSEIEGPVPICTIPTDAPYKTDINLNSLAVHLMSTDYQVNTVGHFSICNDTQILRTNIFTGVHAFMQYFTLYDIKARGFVRPFCFGYISKDNVKLDFNLPSLIAQFDNMSKVLKSCNREWFSSELTQYLLKLNLAKEEFVSRAVPHNLDTDEEDELGVIFSKEEESERMSLSQIAAQYSEIENILSLVSQVESDGTSVQNLNDFKNLIGLGLGETQFYERKEKNELKALGSVLDRLNFIGNTFTSLRIPLVHPLKQKGESLRPLTTLGQIGTLYLSYHLILFYKLLFRDLIFREMEKLTCELLDLSPIHQQNDGSAHFKNGVLKEETFLERDEVELCCVIEKIHESSLLVVGGGRESQSGSYHSFSTDESTNNSLLQNLASTQPVDSSALDYSTSSSFQSHESITENELNSNLLNENSASSSSFSPLKSSTLIDEAKNVPETTSLLLTSSWILVEEPKENFARLSTSENLSLKGEFVEMSKISWWAHASKSKILKNDPGYGLLKFFRQFSSAAHHLLYSILIGRPVILAGSSKYKSRALSIINALIPFVPIGPSEKSFRVIFWHQGILVEDHFKKGLKIVGLCIPERHSIHDLLGSREQNFITILNLEEKRILGPAYSGSYLERFGRHNFVNSNFFDDLSLLCSIGEMLSEVESDLYMGKCMEEDGNEMSRIVRKLKIKNSDVDIIKYLLTLIQSPQEVGKIF